MKGNDVRKTFIEFFKTKGHTFVPSSSLVPGGDQTLLFTNAGMVQFKDVFLGTDHRPYTRAANSQKCMRVAGKHNDLDDVGRDDTHHTFFEMLGNWSFGDYYKPEAISWAWELLTEVWKLPKERLWATCFKDDKGNVSTDEEAAQIWRAQPGMDSSHVLYFGRKDNFWEMADTGPCGPCSEIHFDRGASYCDKQNEPGHICQVNGDCKRFLELWNLVFIQYNRQSVTQLDPLPARHVDTGMGFERIVSVLQDVDSNYRTDLLFPLIEKVRLLTRTTPEERDQNFTPYRVISDHVRAATFLIGEGIVPGNTGRNYICRMIIRRAARFGSKIGLNEPFLAKIAEDVIEIYGGFYSDLEKNRSSILIALTREEERFQKTVEAGMGELQNKIDLMVLSGTSVLDGKSAFDLYATHGLPLELSRDILRESNMDVDVAGFQEAMENHKIASGAGKAFGPMGGEDAEIFRGIFEALRSTGKLSESGVEYNPYLSTEVKAELLAIVNDGVAVDQISAGVDVELVLNKTCFYLESGGQVGDTGWIIPVDGKDWKISISGSRRSAAGIISLFGKVEYGTPNIGESVIARVDQHRRFSIMRNHTATHLLQAKLRKILGEQVRQAGSLVSPEHLRFDFTFSQAVTSEQIEQIELEINQEILEGLEVRKIEKPLTQAVEEGAMALFGEKYGEIVRTVSIGGDHVVSYELCGGTHVDRTSDIGLFVITSEGSAAAGIRRIMAVTGESAYDVIRRRIKTLKQTATLLETSLEDLPVKAHQLQQENNNQRKEISQMRQKIAALEFEKLLGNVPQIKQVPYLVTLLNNADTESMRAMTDIFRSRYISGILVLGSVFAEKPTLIASVTEDLIKRGISAGDIVKQVAPTFGGGGGGRPNLAQAGGKDATKLGEALHLAQEIIEAKLDKI